MDVATRPAVHPHWIFHFRARSLDDAVMAVRDAGGVVLADVNNALGERIVVCDDPQTAGFGLVAARE